MRAAPGFDATVLYPGMMQGVLVELLGESQEVNGFTWSKVLVVEDGREGWVLQSLLSIATPEPNW
jgi:SH3-like domain-containing protein